MNSKLNEGNPVEKTLSQVLEEGQTDLDLWWDSSNYFPEHRERLKRLMKGKSWLEILRSPGLIESVRRDTLNVTDFRNPEATVIDQLLSINGARVKDLIKSGGTDSELLLKTLSEWSEDWRGRHPRISFLGISLTSECNFSPKCLYCNKEEIPSEVSLGTWERVIEEAIGDSIPPGPYVYFTGGEPLLLGSDLYGDKGLIRFAAEHGAAVNVNTNAVLITPEVALKLIKSGLSKVHISLDTADPDTQNCLVSGDRFGNVLEGIYNLQIAREIIGVAYPQIHVNCVLTKLNLDHLPNLLSFLFSIKKIRSENFAGAIKKDPFYRDLLLHVIPVGGEENVDLRPDEEEVRDFLTGIWGEACQVWEEYLDQIGVPPSECDPLNSHGFYTPFLRFDHDVSLENFAEFAARGIYSEFAWVSRCYVAPTQAFILSDGLQYWCGAHTVSRPYSLGNVNEGGLCNNIEKNIRLLEGLPNSYCLNCPAATLAINRNVEGRLMEKIGKWCCGEWDA